MTGVVGGGMQGMAARGPCNVNEELGDMPALFGEIIMPPGNVAVPVGEVSSPLGEVVVSLGEVV